MYVNLMYFASASAAEFATVYRLSNHFDPEPVRKGPLNHGHDNPSLTLASWRKSNSQTSATRQSDCIKHQCLGYITKSPNVRSILLAQLCFCNTCCFCLLERLLIPLIRRKLVSRPIKTN